MAMKQLYGDWDALYNIQKVVSCDIGNKYLLVYLTAKRAHLVDTMAGVVDVFDMSIIGSLVSGIFTECSLNYDVCRLLFGKARFETLTSSIALRDHARVVYHFGQRWSFKLGVQVDTCAFKRPVADKL
ncbi:hypothetical protein GOBAR_AA30505 [Gossypium barbadense]|uniref:Uncharacterized protein n=1 Tax=Gossypium barbadense TaxID=3634 RepID=A0A2P5WGG7_GOSBA|nr:hypothetical protein GOBAR_AA30505 [Gossypium barbadense]